MMRFIDLFFSSILIALPIVLMVLSFDIFKLSPIGPMYFYLIVSERVARFLKHLGMKLCYLELTFLNLSIQTNSGSDLNFIRLIELSNDDFGRS